MAGLALRSALSASTATPSYGRSRSCGRLAAVTCRAAVAPLATARRQQPSVLKMLAACCEVQDQVRRYEVLAGRSAMIGFAVALAVEGITEKGVFFGMAAETAVPYACGAASVLAGAALLAVARNQGSGADGQGLLEAVYASLTAVRRSAASVTETQVDTTVDAILAECGGMSVLGNLLETDELTEELY